jgi:hypothetical protein
MTPAHVFHPPRIRCREIGEADLEAILDLLTKSPFGRPRDFWAEGLQRLGANPTPPGFPRYGYLLEVNGLAAGVLLVIAASVPGEHGPLVRCNVSSWYVWPPFRAYGSLLVSQALKRKDATYTDLSPLQHTLRLVKAQGFERYCDGLFTALPAFKLRSPRGARATLADATLAPGPDLSAEEIALLLDHAAYGYIALVVTCGGRRHPFVLEPSTHFRLLRTAYLTYARSIEEFVRFAAPIGRYLARRGTFVVTLDANGRVPGLLGRYVTVTPKYYRGPHPPQLGDVAYSERVVLGLRFPANVSDEPPIATDVVSNV